MQQAATAMAFQQQGTVPAGPPPPYATPPPVNASPGPSQQMAMQPGMFVPEKQEYQAVAPMQSMQQPVYQQQVQQVVQGQMPQQVPMQMQSQMQPQVQTQVQPQFQGTVGAMPPPAPYQPLQQTTMQPTPDYQEQQLQQALQNLPPEKLMALQKAMAQQQQSYQQFQQPQQQQQWINGTPPPNLAFNAPPTAAIIPDGKGKALAQTATPAKDEKKTGKMQRFLGDTLVGRFARASVQTASSTLKMPAALSPWGDNNPVTLPNVRYRDAVLFTTFAFVGAPLVEGTDSFVSDIFGADSFVSEIISSGAGAIGASIVVKTAVFQIIEQAIDKGVIEHMLPEEEKMIQTTNVKSLQVGIKHKLMGVDADLRFTNITPTRDFKGCEKGWFCPYLFASARTPLIPRANDFSIAQFFGPFVGADYAMAHKLVAESTSVMSMCDPDPTHDIGTNRLVVAFVGISPFRAGMWSTSRRPGCGTVVFHLFDGCPALVLPVTARAPIVGWSPWTLAQMRGVGGVGGYQAEVQHEQVCEFLDTVVSLEQVNAPLRARYVDILGRAVSLIINGALALEKVQDKTILGKVDPERSGIVMFRY